MERKTVSKEIDQIDYVLNGLTIDEAIAWLQKQKTDNARIYPEFSTFKLELCQNYDGEQGLYIRGERLENDAELAKRQKEEDTWKEYRRQQFEALKKEFGS
jgi:hypothetical protein